MLDNVERFEQQLEKYTLEDIEEKDMRAVITEAEQIVIKKRLLSQRSLVSHRSNIEAQIENASKVASEMNTVKQIASMFENIIPKDEEVQQEVRNLLEKNIQKKMQGWKQSKVRFSELRNLESVDPKTGNLLKGNNPVKDSNIFSDLNYGDFLIVFWNPLYDFMFEEIEDEKLKVRLIKRFLKAQEKASGVQSSIEKNKMNIEDEKYSAEMQERKEASRKQIMESLGFSYDGDYEEILQQIAKETKTKNPIFVSQFPENQPNNPEYGSKPT